MPRNARTSLYQNFSASPGCKCYHLSISPMVVHWKFLLTHWVLVSLCPLKSVLVVFCLNASIGECRTREKLSTVTTPFLQQKVFKEGVVGGDVHRGWSHINSHVICCNGNQAQLSLLANFFYCCKAKGRRILSFLCASRFEFFQKHS